jgi:hypothetical protein
MLGKRLALGTICFDPSAKRYPHAVRHGVHRFHDIAHPGPRTLHFIDHRAADTSYSTVTQFQNRACNKRAIVAHASPMVGRQAADRVHYDAIAADVRREAIEYSRAAIECGQLIIEPQGRAATAIDSAQESSVNVEDDRQKCVVNGGDRAFPKRVAFLDVTRVQRAFVPGAPAPHSKRPGDARSPTAVVGPTRVRKSRAGKSGAEVYGR